jgi:uncharacterized LabA/DUF88 family protein
VWERIRDDGFDVKVFDRNIRNKEKGVDMEMGMDIAERLYTVQPPRTILIDAGDADYVPAVSRAKTACSIPTWEAARRPRRPSRSAGV